jgi:acyl transferase domain-containing protein/aryl carrier-like protein
VKEPAGRVKNLSAVRLALAAKELHAGREDLALLEAEPVAVIGLGCRFPGGADSPERFWQLLVEGRDAIREVPPDRWDVDEVYDPAPATPGKMITRWGGFIDQVDRFDPAFFGISSREAAIMDPQQRLLLEVAWEALERAGCPPPSLAGSNAGVFIGIHSQSSDYFWLQLVDPAGLNAWSGPGTSHSVAAGRLSYLLDLRGPSFVIDTACSSSLVAVHLACRSLRSRECDLAIAGGTNLILTPESTIAASMMRIMAADGRCKTFDARADGYVRSEGCGLVVLKRLADAITGGDPILAVIRGSAINQDGRSNGLTAPNELAQEAVIQEALAAAGVEPEQITCIEAHGTGTPLGDPIEVEALRATYGRQPSRRCALGSVKTNIGHLEGAAGIAGLIKVVLSLLHGTVPPHLHVRSLNPLLRLEETPFFVPQEPWRWPAGATPRCAAVSSFGWSGTNSHVIVEEAPALPPVEKPGGAPRETARPLLLPLSAKGEPELKELAGAWRGYLRGGARYADSPGGGEPTLDDLCYTAAVRSTHHEHRICLQGESKEALAEILDSWLEGREHPALFAPAHAPSRQPRIAFVFSGQGSQWAGMGLRLLKEEPAFRRALEECDRAVSSLAGWSLLEQLQRPEGDPTWGHIDVIQPTLFGLQVALAALWRHRGIEPDAVIGHSMGEVAAACVAGMLSAQDAATIICRRSRLMRDVRGRGAMGLVELSLEDAAKALAGLEDRLAVAASNGPRSTVISGDAASLGELLERLSGKGIFCRPIRVDVASHSPQVDGLLPALRQAIGAIQPRRGDVPLYSTVSGNVLHGPELEPEYWVKNLREPVRFWPSLRKLVEAGHSMFLELSGHPTLLPSVEDGLRSLGAHGVTLSSMRRGEDERAVISESLARAYVNGRSIAWRALHPRGGRCTTRPAYPWRRERVWIEAPRSGPSRPGGRRGGHPVLGAPVESPVQPGTFSWEIAIDPGELPFLPDHRVKGVALLPAAMIVELMLSCGRALGLKQPYLAGLELTAAVPIPQEGAVTAQVVLAPASGQELSVRFFSKEAPSRWQLHAEGRLGDEAEGAGPPGPAGDAISKTFSRMISGAQEGAAGPDGSAARFYRELHTYGNEYGPAFQGLERVWREEGAALGRLASASQGSPGRGYLIHPARLDAAIQVLLGAFPSARSALVPVSISRIRLRGAPEQACWSCAAFPTLPSESDDSAAGDLALFDEQRRPVLEIEGLRLKRVGAAPGAAQLTGPSAWLFDVEWVRAAPPDGRSTAGGRPAVWLILSDGSRLSDEVRRALEAGGARCVVASTERRPEELARLVGQVRDALGTAELKILHLWSLDHDPFSDRPPEEVQRGYLERCSSVLHLCQVLAEGALPLSGLWLVTRGAQAVRPGAPVSPLQSALWGLGRTIAHEAPRLSLRMVDLDPTPDSTEVSQLLAELSRDSEEDCLALRRDGRYVPRLDRAGAQGAPGAPALQQRSSPRRTRPAQGRQFRLEMDAPGVLDDLVLRAFSPPPPGPGEVQIEVDVAGLNFLDVLSAMGRYPGLPRDHRLRFGIECAGRVVALGPGVRDLALGDEVVAAAQGTMASRVNARIEMTARRPSRLSPESAATALCAFVTASYGLRTLGRMAAGERVLIHSASGGTGLAAVQLALRAGAVVYATAGNEEKREYLRRLGVRRAMDSRSFDFVDEVLADTGGEGVDLVLNSLTGEAISRSLSLLAPYGRFIEIGKQDIYEDRALKLGPFRRNLSYFAVDLARMMEDRPEKFGAIMRQVLEELETGRIEPLPLTLFGISQVGDAFRTMAQTRHIGKIGLNVRDPAVQLEDAPAQRDIGANATYLVTGGLGGLGLEVAGWLIRRGARHLVLVGRSAPSPRAEALLSEWRQAGAQVTVARGDVASPAALADVLSTLRATMPPLKGVVHAAGLLDDATLPQQSVERFRRVAAPKVEGAWNLHLQTRPDPLNFFILFSSVTSLFGSPGQSNYTAANAFLDGLAGYRRSLELPALSIHWGTWSEVGLAAAQANRGARLALSGIEGFSPREGIEALEHVFSRWEGPTVAALRLDFERYQDSHPYAGKAPFFERLGRRTEKPAAPAQDLKTSLLAAPVAQRRGRLTAVLQEQLALVLKLQTSRAEPQRPFRSMGLDSLLALEFRNRLEARLGLSLSVTMLWNHPTLEALAVFLAEQMGLPLEDAAPEEPPPEARASEDAARQRIGEMSEAEAEALLLQELEKIRS